MQYGLIGNDALEARRPRRGRAGLPEGARALSRRRRHPEKPRPFAACPEEHRCRHGRAQGGVANGREPRSFAEAQLEIGSGRGRAHGRAGARPRCRCRGAAAVSVPAAPAGAVLRQGPGHRVADRAAALAGASLRAPPTTSSRFSRPSRRTAEHSSKWRRSWRPKAIARAGQGANDDGRAGREAPIRRPPSITTAALSRRIRPRPRPQPGSGRSGLRRPCPCPRLRLPLRKNRRVPGARHRSRGLGSVHAPQPKVPSIEYESEPAPAPAPPAEARPPARRRPLRPPPHPRPSRCRPRARQSGWRTAVRDADRRAEVFAKYGLTDKAIERLFSLVRRRPDLLKARERLVELLAESGNPALPGGRGAGRGLQRSRTPRRRQPNAGSPEPGPGGELDVPTSECRLLPRAAWRSSSRNSTSSSGLSSGRAPLGPSSRRESSSRRSTSRLRHSTPRQPRSRRRRRIPSSWPWAARQSSRRRDAQGRREEPSASTEVPRSPRRTCSRTSRSSSTWPRSSRRNSATRRSVKRRARSPAPQGEVSLEEIFREFKKGVEQQLSAEDYETH